MRFFMLRLGVFLALYVTLAGRLASVEAQGKPEEFSPLIELIVPAESSFVDFETARVLEAPKLRGLKGFGRWAAENGFDAVSAGGAEGLLGFDMIALQVEGPLADFFPELPVDTARKRIKELASGGRPGTPVQLDARSGVGPAATYLFQTREGTGGILQIAGWDAQIQAVAIHYRILGAPAATLAADPEAASGRAAAKKGRFTAEKNAFLHCLARPRSGPSAIDLDRGHLLLTLEDEEANIAAGIGSIAYHRQQGIDLWAKPLDTEALKAFEMSVVRVAKEVWNDEARARRGLEMLRATRDFPLLDLHIARYAAGPATFLFKTRQGALGVLQILRFDLQKKGAEIRYKLLAAK